MAGQESNGPRMYYQEDRGTPKGGAFWGRSTDEKQLVLVKMLLKTQTLNHWTWSAPGNLAFSKSHHVIYIHTYISLCSISIVLRMLHQFMTLKISTPNSACYKISTCCEVGRIRLGWSGTFRQGRLSASEVSWERRRVLRAGGRKSGKAFWRCWCHCSGWTGPQLVHDLVY